MTAATAWCRRRRRTRWCGALRVTLLRQYLSVVVSGEGGSQYAAASRLIADFSGILDHPLSRAMTALAAGARCLLRGARPRRDRKIKTGPEAPFKIASAAPEAYLILDSLNSTCLRATGSYFFLTSLSVMVREFFLAT